MDPILTLENRIGSLAVDDYEICLVRSRNFSAEAQEGQIEFSQEAVERGVAIRLFKGGRCGFGSTSDLGEDALTRIVKSASQGLELVDEEVRFQLPFYIPSPNPPLESRGGPGGDARFDLAIALEKEARRFDPRITRVRDAGYYEQAKKVILKNSRGLSCEFDQTRYELSLMVVAEEKGDQQMAWESDFSPDFGGLDPAKVAREAAEKAVSLLGASPIATQTTPAVLDPVVATSFLGVLSSSFLGDQVQRNRSALADRLGEEIYAKEIEIVDDGNLKGGYEGAPFDGEGTRTARNSVVIGGVLKKFLYDSISAPRARQESTGNSRRPNLKEPPRVGPTNFFVSPGRSSQDDLLGSLEKGLWVRDVIGVHTADPVTGDFSLGASGIWIEKGRRQRPVRGITLSGNLHEVFKSVVQVGGDLRFYHSFGSPPLLIRSIDVGGS